jgi:hypothetical protein
MADTRSGRDKKALDEERRQREREMEQALEEVQDGDLEYEELLADLVEQELEPKE